MEQLLIFTSKSYYALNFMSFSSAVYFLMSEMGNERKMSDVVHINYKFLSLHYIFLFLWFPPFYFFFYTKNLFTLLLFYSNFFSHTLNGLFQLKKFVFCYDDDDDKAIEDRIMFDLFFLI